MDPVLLAPLAFFVGLMAAALLGSTIIRWVALLYSTSTMHGGDFLGPPRRRLIAWVPFIALLHPAPYAIGAALYGLWLLVAGRLGGWWYAFYTGFALYVIFISTRIVRVIRNWRQSRAASHEV